MGLSGSGLWKFRRALLTVVLLAVVVFQAFLTWPIQSASYLLPAYVLVPTAFLLAIQLAADLHQRESVQVDDMPTAVPGAVLWTLLMPVLLVMLGLVAAGALYTLLFLRWRGGESWGLAVSAMVVVAGGLSSLAWLLNKPQLFWSLVW